MKQIVLNIILVSLLISSCKKTIPEWQRIDMGFDDNFHDVFPLDKHNLIAYSYGSGLIVKSIDQGLTWKEVYKTDSVYFEQIEFPTSDVGFICGNTNKILKTENGGNKWIEIKIDSIPASPFIYGMKFITTEIGYISLINRTEKGFESIIYQTTNSGLAWKAINSVPEMILNLEQVKNELWASGNNVVVKNIDNNDWQIVYRDTTKLVGQIRDFLINDEKLIMISSNGYIICRKESLITKEQITRNRLRSIVFVSDQKLIVAGDNNKEEGNLFESIDNGVTWKLCKKDFHDIHRLKIKNGLIVGVGKNDEFIRMKL